MQFTVLLVASFKSFRMQKKNFALKFEQTNFSFLLLEALHNSSGIFLVAFFFICLSLSFELYRKIPLKIQSFRKKSTVCILIKEIFFSQPDDVNMGDVSQGVAMYKYSSHKFHIGVNLHKPKFQVSVFLKNILSLFLI